MLAIVIFFVYLLVCVFGLRAFDVFGYQEALPLVVFIYLLSMIWLLSRYFNDSVDRPEATEHRARLAAKQPACTEVGALRLSAI